MQERTIDISVIVPSYKPKEYLWRCLDSLMAQTLDHDRFEVVVVLNGCKEPYLSQVNEYVAGQGCGVTFNVLQTDQGGVSNARNMGIDAARGRYISFVDDDDWVSEDYLSSLMEVATDDRTMPIANARTYHEEAREYGEDYLTRAFRRNKGSASVTLYSGRSFLSLVWGKLIPRAMIANTRFSLSQKRGEDALFMFEISKRLTAMRLTVDSCSYIRSLRKDSASRSDMPFIKVFRERGGVLCKLTAVYLKDPFHYDALLYATRMVATVMMIIKKK